MNYFISLLLLFSSLFCHGQNWEIAVPGQRYLYQPLHSNSSIQNYYTGFQIDSTLFQQNQLGHYRLSKQLEFDTTSNLCYEFKDTKIGAELLIESNRQILISSNGDSLLFPKISNPIPNHWLVYHNLQNGERIRATFLRYDTFRFKNQLDSIAWFRLRHLDSSNQIINTGYNGALVFSKNNGLINTFNWAEFNNRPPVKLKQMEFDIMTRGDIYDYQAGDEFHTSFHNLVPGGPPSYSNIKILARINTGSANSIRYAREYKSESSTVDWSTGNPIVTKHVNIGTDTITYNNLDVLIGSLPQQFEANSNYFTSHLGGFRWYGLDTYRIGAAPLRDSTISNTCYNYINTGIGDRSEIIKGCGIFEYVNAPGYSTRDILDYYKKGNITWGTPRIITGIQSHSKANEFELFPNPSSGIIHLKGIDKEAIERVSIYTIEGRLIKNLKLDKLNSIDLSELPNGMYLLHINGEKTNLIQKILLQKN